MSDTSLRKRNSRDDTHEESETAATANLTDVNNDEEAENQSMYENICCYASYTQMFLARLGHDVVQSLMYYVFADAILPPHLTELTRVHNIIHKDYDRIFEMEHDLPRRKKWSFHATVGCVHRCISQGINVVKSYIFHNEDDANFRFKDGKQFISAESYKKELPMWVILENNMSNCSSEEILTVSNIEGHDYRKSDERYNENVSSTAVGVNTPNPSLKITESITQSHKVTTNLIKKNLSAEELQIIGLNIQNENQVVIDDGDNESIVLTYLRNKDNIMQDVDPTLLSTKKKSSLLNNVPKMETIPEGEQFSAFPVIVSTTASTQEIKDLADNTAKCIEFDANASPTFSDSVLRYTKSFFEKFKNYAWENFRENIEEDAFFAAVDDMHETTMHLWMATLGDAEGLHQAIRYGENLNEVDHLGRTALHLAVESGSTQTVRLLLDAGLDPNAEDGMGNTPLFYVFIKKPILSIANLLFEHGAIIPRRKSPTDVGLFLEFIIMCSPTLDEKAMVNLLLKYGALLEDPQAPGGRQALHYAAMSNNWELISFLWSLGADLNVTNHRNMTPMDVAIFYSCKHAQFCLEDIGISNILSGNRLSDQSFLRLGQTPQQGPSLHIE